MKLLDKLIVNTVFAIQILLAFLLLFESKVSLPIGLAPLGRMHPLVLHFPIGLLVLVGLIQFFKKEFPVEAFGKIQRFTLLIAAVTTSIAALMGFFLSKEEGYGGDLMTLHKWTGVALSFFTYGLLILDQYKSRISPLLFQGGLALSIVLLVVAGHFGAGLTHGENFVMAPLMKAAPSITEDTPVFEAAIMPVLEQKCEGCHNPRKRKGELDMSTLEGLLAGGENGEVWVAEDADNSPMIHRARLPLKDEEHMPPDGKPQLTEAEIDLLHAWIAAGADVKQTIKEISAESPLFAMVNPLLDPVESNGPLYAFEAASVKTVERLNTPFVSVFPQTSSSPALTAKFFVRQNYDPNRLKSLADVKAQLIHLNLAKMPITDADMATIGQFERLEKLILNGTDITGASLEELKSCSHLHTIALSNTAVGPEIAEKLAALPALKTVYVWSTKITGADKEAMEAAAPEITFDLGFVPDAGEILKLTPPQLLTESQVIGSGEKVVLKNVFPGAQVHYTLDGTEPDSLNSPVYEGPISIDSYTELVAKTYLPEWISSEAITFTFFKKGFTPDSAELVNQPARDYPGEGAITLIDNEKGLASTFKSSKWMGFRGNKPFEAYLYFESGTAPEVSNLTFSYCVNMGQYIMPPASVEVWAGADKSSLKRLVSERIPLPNKETSNRVAGLNLDIPKGRYACYKVIAQPILKLPEWHRGAGDKAWFFIDEVFLN